jgi:hypothetical protein
MKYATALILVPAIAFGVAACDVQKTQEGKLPDVEVKGGQVPKYDVDVGDVDVGTEKKEITVPTIDIDTPAEDRAEEKAGKD